MSEQASAPADGGQGAADATQATQTTAAPADQGEPKPFHTVFESPEDRGYTENKGWKSPADLLNSYRNLEKLRGVPPDRLLQIPENLDDAEAVKPLLSKLGYGAPEKPEDYGLSALEGADADQAKMLETIAHKHGVPDRVAKAVFSEVLAAERQAQEDFQRQTEESVAIEVGKLKARIGMDKWDGFKADADRAMRNFGFTDEDLQTMAGNVGAARTYEIWAEVGKRLAESTLVEGERKQSFSTSPDAAKAERDRLMSDKDFAAKYVGGDRTARERVSRLNQIIAQGGG